MRYGAESGTSAVRVTLQDVVQNLAGNGPRASTPVTGRNGGTFTNFGDYSINLLEHVHMGGDPPSRALYDTAAVAIVKNPAWAEAHSIAAPVLENGVWRERPDNPRKIVLRENFNRQAIIDDFYATMNNYQLADIVT